MRRFFFHYRKRTGGMTIHFAGKCIPVKHVICLVPCETHRRKRQPKLVMRGWARSVKVHMPTETATIA